MESGLRAFFGQTRHHDVDQAYKDRAMNFIKDEFVRFSLETELQEFLQPAVSSTVIASFVQNNTCLMSLPTAMVMSRRS